MFIYYGGELIWKDSVVCSGKPFKYLGKFDERQVTENVALNQVVKSQVLCEECRASKDIIVSYFILLQL